MTVSGSTGALAETHAVNSATHGAASRYGHLVVTSGNSKQPKKHARTYERSSKKHTTATTPPVTTPAVTPPPATNPPATAAPASTPYPLGTADSTEPSGLAPPSATAMAGYSQTYVNDFTGTSLPSGWDTFSGNPGGDPGEQWAASHVVVSGGLIQLNTWQDSAYGGEWVAGGICQCGQSQTYGAYFVRSRLTGAGPTGVQLLWPVANVGHPKSTSTNPAGPAPAPRRRFTGAHRIPRTSAP